MLLNCARLSPVWMSIRVSSLRRSHISCKPSTKSGANASQTAPMPTAFVSLLRRRSLHTRTAQRWARQQFVRWRHRKTADTIVKLDEIGGAKQRISINTGVQAKASQPKVKIQKSDFIRLLNLAKSEKLALVAAVGCLLVSSAITVSVPFVLGRVIDIIFNKDGLNDNGMSKLHTFSLVLLGVCIVGGLANFARIYLFNSISLRIVRELRSRVYRTMLVQESTWFDTKGSGELINRLVNDTFFVGNSLSQNVSDGLRSLVMVSAGTGMMIYTSPQLALVSSLVVPCMAGAAIVYGRYVRKLTRETLDKFAEISKYAEERFGNVKTVKIFCRELEESRNFDKMLGDAMQLGYKDTFAKSVFFGLTGFSGNFIIISVLYYGGTLVVQDAITIGALTSFMLYAGYVAISINGLSNFYSELNKGVGASQRIWEILDREYSISIGSGIVPLNKPLGAISFENVAFNFPARPDSRVLNNFTLKLLPGQTTAVVGRSGSGKTTIASLLLRLYDPQQGAIMLDDVDLRTLNPQWLRSHISAVSQEPVLFSGTIRENILYGLNPGTTASEQLLQEVVRESHIDEFASQLPDGLETLVGQRGIMLSGGQKQRVAIARALIRNPKILILDEATSALDSVSEQLVQTALSHMVRGRTVLTIAHRLSTIRNAHKIAVLDNGEIVEYGNYDSLMLKDRGAFKELVAKQAFLGAS